MLVREVAQTDEYLRTILEDLMKCGTLPHVFGRQDTDVDRLKYIAKSGSRLALAHQVERLMVELNVSVDPSKKLKNQKGLNRVEELKNYTADQQWRDALDQLVDVGITRGRKAAIEEGKVLLKKALWEADENQQTLQKSQSQMDLQSKYQTGASVEIYNPAAPFYLDPLPNTNQNNAASLPQQISEQALPRMRSFPVYPNCGPESQFVINN